MADLVCYACGADLEEVPLPISRHANCPGCYTELHCCRMCTEYDPGVADGCRDDRADPPHNKEGANFCEFFKPRSGLAAPRSGKADSARAELDALFGGGEKEDVAPPASDEDDARAKLDALFKKDDDRA